MSQPSSPSMPALVDGHSSPEAEDGIAVPRSTQLHGLNLVIQNIGKVADRFINVVKHVEVFSDDVLENRRLVAECGGLVLEMRRGVDLGEFLCPGVKIDLPNRWQQCLFGFIHLLEGMSRACVDQTFKDTAAICASLISDRFFVEDQQARGSSEEQAQHGLRLFRRSCFANGEDLREIVDKRSGEVDSAILNEMARQMNGFVSNRLYVAGDSHEGEARGQLVVGDAQASLLQIPMGNVTSIVRDNGQAYLDA
ncbi:hypothetical protein BKA70DRAFT_1229994 [Coprinopsis sp. MPI-PUGE-AT-0042]|nr:hypothetical protein BKA70DRAFT_1229994 [Coprinopsis sp. MPI-PUGE-AT-0042]